MTKSRLWRGSNVSIDVKDPGLKTPFGELKTAGFTPMAGWSFRYNVNPGLVKLPLVIGNGGTIGFNTNKAVLNTGTDSQGFAEISTVKTVRYTPRLGGSATFTAHFDTPKLNSRQYIGVIDDTDGWAFGYDLDTQFGILRRSGGIDTWAYQDTWNRDLATLLKPELGNVFQIEYQWLGYGMQYFYIENLDGNLAPVHVIAYANTSVDTSVENPDLPITMRVENVGNTSNVSLASPSAMAGLYGPAYDEAISLVIAEDNLKTISGGAETPIISFYNPPEYQGKNNRLFVQAIRLIITSDGNKNVIGRAWANGTPDGAATYVPINNDITPVQVSRDISSLGKTGAVQIGTFPLAKLDSLPIDLTGSKFLGYPGQYITIVAESSNSSEITAGVTFRQFL